MKENSMDDFWLGKLKSVWSSGGNFFLNLSYLHFPVWGATKLSMETKNCATKNSRSGIFRWFLQFNIQFTIHMFSYSLLRVQLKFVPLFHNLVFNDKIFNKVSLSTCSMQIFLIMPYILIIRIKIVPSPK